MKYFPAAQSLWTATRNRSFGFGRSTFGKGNRILRGSWFVRRKAVMTHRSPKPSADVARRSRFGLLREITALDSVVRHSAKGVGFLEEVNTPSQSGDDSPQSKAFGKDE
jgi:hypothetical protein